MNRYLMMSAAALLATVGSGASTQAGYRSFDFGNSSGGSYCDGGQIGWHGVYYTGLHVYTGCGGSTNASPFYLGIEGKSKGIGPNVNMADTNVKSGFCTYDLPSKIAIGGHWTLYCSTDGLSWFFVNQGKILAGPAKHRPGAKSTLDAVKELLAKRKSEQH